MHDFDQFEQRLADALRSDADASVGPFEAGSIAKAAIAANRSGATRVRRSPPHARRFGRGRGITLLAAASLLLVGGALAAGSGVLRLPTVVPPLPSPSVVAFATTSPDAMSPGPSESAAPSASPIPVAGPGGAWIQTGTMVTPREGYSAVRLQDGRVLVVGGYSGPSGYADDLTSAELYDPASGTWSAAGSISKPLIHDAVTVLRDGRVLVLVGYVEDGPSGAEVYDPASGTWTATGPMASGVDKLDGGFTMLRDGRVLATGRDGAQVYDPATGNWTATGPMARECCGMLQVLQDGRILDIGGAQLYDPASGNWTATGKRNYEGYGAAVVLLSDGKVLVAGGRGFKLPDNYYDLDSAEVYDPDTGSWTAIADMHAKTFATAAFLQPDGKVLVVGSRSAEVYDPATGTWTALPSRPGINYNDAMLLSDGTVRVTGELPGDADESACTADVYDPRIGSWTTTSTMPECGPGSLTPLLDGTLLGAGGSDCTDDGECGSTGTAKLYVPAGVALPPLPAFPSPPAYTLPSATPVPPVLPPADGPVPPNARSWTITVDNQSSEPATMFVADSGELRLVGSATPNVVPAGATVKVTFRFAAKGDAGWITVNPRLGDGADEGFIGVDDIGMPGKILIGPEGDWGWVSP
ncbi:MAG TPA: kelch repeat-containing protein [Candidatus Limnocylindrales bacterium]|nr:kelch repeat-containing protein [Candidatus Limnocylindrales bacterium]